MPELTFNKIVLLFVFLMFSYGESNASESFPNLTGPYLGQKPPKLTPELFAPGIVSVNGRHEYGISFSPALDEVYFSTQKSGGVAAIHYSNMKQGKWQPVEKLSLTAGEKAGEMHPFMNKDGKQLYFTAYNSDFTDTKIWTTQRDNKKWGEAKKLDSVINNDEVFYSVITDNGDLFYTDIFKAQTFVSSYQQGNYGQPNLVNVPFGLHAFASKDQDYLLVDAVAKDQNREDKDIYVYFKNNDGTWSKPINLGNTVNSEFYETVPSVTPDGKYLFFSRYNEEGGLLSNFYWVSTEVIERLRP